MNQSRSALKSLGIRAGVLALILGAVFALAELWHRGVLKYVQDSRRRYQLLLLRRIALWTLVVIIIGFTFASELGSIVTFAGLITAGLAVAMQSVLVSIVGYFFLIGKYGIRVGDRVQIGEVSGEIIELGMVRMYLMATTSSPTVRKMSHQKLLTKAERLMTNWVEAGSVTPRPTKRLAKMGTTNLSSAPTTRMAMTMTETG